jgi:hypothetical protein
MLHIVGYGWDVPCAQSLYRAAGPAAARQHGAEYGTCCCIGFQGAQRGPGAGRKRDTHSMRADGMSSMERGAKELRGPTQQQQQQQQPCMHQPLLPPQEQHQQRQQQPPAPPPHLDPQLWSQPADGLDFRTRGSSTVPHQAGPAADAPWRGAAPPPAEEGEKAPLRESRAATDALDGT